MHRQQQQVSTYYGEEKRIPRRRSAPYGQGSYPTTSAPAQRQRQTEEDDGILDEKPYRLPNSSRRYDRLPIQREQAYEIPLTDGTVMHVMEQELLTMPQEYIDAAQLVTAQPRIAAPLPKQRRQPHPKQPAPSDGGSIYAGTAKAGDTNVPRRRRLPRFHWLVWVGLAMFVMIFGWIALSALGNWWTMQTNDWTYGRPRTYQVDANVGHGTAKDPDSHFIAQNLNRHIIIIEIPGNDPSKAKIYIGPTLIGPGQELTPVTLSFEDVNGDGRKDLVIHVEDSTFIFLNQQVQGVWQFVPAPNQQ